MWFLVISHFTLPPIHDRFNEGIFTEISRPGTNATTITTLGVDINVPPPKQQVGRLIVSASGEIIKREMRYTYRSFQVGNVQTDRMAKVSAVDP